MKKILKVGLPVFVILVILLQFVGPKAQNPPENANETLFQLTKTPPEVQKVLKESCYDCHSNTSVYPWYASVAPVSWLVINHINDGRKHLNYSEWGKYDLKKQIHKLEETIEMVNAGEMPLAAYVMMHAGAELDQAEKDLLLNWSKETMAQLHSANTETVRDASPSSGVTESHDDSKRRGRENREDDKQKDEHSGKYKN